VFLDILKMMIYTYIVANISREFKKTERKHVLVLKIFTILIICLCVVKRVGLEGRGSISGLIMIEIEIYIYRFIGLTSANLFKHAF